jgi:hypothetical protein
MNPKIPEQKGPKMPSAQTGPKLNSGLVKMPSLKTEPVSTAQPAPVVTEEQVVAVTQNHNWVGYDPTKNEFLCIYKLAGAKTSEYRKPSFTEVERFVNMISKQWGAHVLVKPEDQGWKPAPQAQTPPRVNVNTVAKPAQPQPQPVPQLIKTLPVQRASGAPLNTISGSAQASVTNPAAASPSTQTAVAPQVTVKAEDKSMGVTTKTVPSSTSVVSEIPLSDRLDRYRAQTRLLEAITKLLELVPHE